MKKQFSLISIFMLFIFHSSVAQFTVRVAGGYAWPGFQTSEGITGPIIDLQHPNIDALGPLANVKDTMNGNPASYKNVRGSYGQGMNFTLGLGYTVNKYFNFELGISYLKSQTITADQTRQLTLSVAGPTGPFIYIPAYLFAHIKSNAFGVSISPSFTVQAPIKKTGFMPYARIGIALPVYGTLTDKISIDQNSGLASLLNAPYFLGKHTDVTFQTQGTVSVGLNGAVGLKYNIRPYVSVFIEANGQYLVTRAKSAKITQWDADGVSQLNNRGVYRTQFNFVSQLNGSSNNAQYNPNYSTNVAKDDVMPTAPFSNLGLNVGVTFNLGKRTLKKSDSDKSKDKRAML